MSPNGEARGQNQKVTNVDVYLIHTTNRKENMEKPNEIEQMFIDAINFDVIDEMDKSQLEALLKVLDKVR